MASPTTPHSRTLRVRGLLRAGPAALLALAFASGALAQPPGPPGPGRHGPPPIERVLEKHAEQLGLDEATREQIEAIAAEARPESEALRETLRERHDELRRLLSEDAPDEDAVMAQAERIGAAEVALQKSRLRTMLRIRALLTPEQRAELVRIHEARGRRGPGAEHGRPPRDR
ncbi:MAG: Spy/CpxP family protein refolding chaperone [Myxococcota bacterium]